MKLTPRELAIRRFAKSVATDYLNAAEAMLTARAGSEEHKLRARVLGTVAEHVLRRAGVIAENAPRPSHEELRALCDGGT